MLLLATWRGDYALARDEVQEALTIAGRVVDDDLTILANILLVVVVGGLGDREQAEAHADAAIEGAGRRNDRWAEAVGLCGLCWVHAAAGAFKGHEQTFEDMMAAAADVADPLVYAMSLDNLAELRMWQGRLPEAAALARDSLSTLLELRMAYASLGSLHTAAELMTRTGDWANAVRVQAAADKVATDTNVGLWPPWSPRRERLFEVGRERLGRDGFDRAVRNVRQWSFQDAAAEAIGALTPIAEDATRGSVASDGSPLAPATNRRSEALSDSGEGLEHSSGSGTDE